MRVGFTSDFHLGFARNERKGEDFKQAKEALKTLLENDVDIIVNAGDIFDNPYPKPETLADAFKLFSYAKEKMNKIEVEIVDKDKEVKEIIPILAIHGTHDRRSRGEMNPVELLHHFNILYHLQNKHVIYEDFDFYGLGGVPESLALDIIKALNPRPVKDNSFFIFHQNIKPFIPGKNSLSFQDLPAGFKYYVDGHIHSPHLVKNLLIVGSTIVTQMKEDENKKGVWIFEDGNFEFIPIKTRPFYFIKIDITNKTLDEIEKIVDYKLNEVLKNVDEKPLIKLKIVGILKEGYKPSDISIDIKNYDAIISVDKKLTYRGLNINLENNRINLDSLIFEAFKKVFENKLDVDLNKLYNKILKGDAEEVWKILMGDENAP